MHHVTAAAGEMRRKRPGGSRRGEATSVTRGHLMAAVEGVGAGMMIGTIGEESEGSTTSGDTTIEGRLVAVTEVAGEATTGAVTADEEAELEGREGEGITANIVQVFPGTAQIIRELPRQPEAAGTSLPLFASRDYLLKVLPLFSAFPLQIFELFGRPCSPTIRRQSLASSQSRQTALSLRRPSFRLRPRFGSHTRYHG